MPLFSQLTNHTLWIFVCVCFSRLWKINLWKWYESKLLEMEIGLGTHWFWNVKSKWVFLETVVSRKKLIKTILYLFIPKSVPVQNMGLGFNPMVWVREAVYHSINNDSQILVVLTPYGFISLSIMGHQKALFHLVTQGSVNPKAITRNVWLLIGKRQTDDCSTALLRLQPKVAHFG